MVKKMSQGYLVLFSSFRISWLFLVYDLFGIDIFLAKNTNQHVNKVTQLGNCVFEGMLGKKYFSFPPKK